MADTAALKATGVPILYDGAQGLGAIPVDAAELGCDFYAAAGQKWLCGPDGSGYLYVRGDRSRGARRIVAELHDRRQGRRRAGLRPAPGAARFDTGTSPSGPTPGRSPPTTCSTRPASSWVHERATGLAEQLAQMLADRGLEVAPRGASTLVSWRSDDPRAMSSVWPREGIVVRNLPGRGLVRASIGAWASEEELDRLASARGVTIPDPNQVHPLPTTDRVVFLKAVVTSEKIEVGDYTYYDDPGDPTAWEQQNVLYGYGPSAW